MTAPRRFRKKPVEIDAWRLPVWGEPNNPRPERPSAEHPVFDVTKYVDECCAIANWCGGISQMMLTEDESSPNGIRDLYGPHMLVPTLEGQMIARPGDYVICGVKGEFYPCKPDIFAATYEAVVPDPVFASTAERAEFEAQSAASRAVMAWIDKPHSDGAPGPALIGCTPAMVAQIAVDAYRKAQQGDRQPPELGITGGSQDDAYPVGQVTG